MPPETLPARNARRAGARGAVVLSPRSSSNRGFRAGALLVSIALLVLFAPGPRAEEATVQEPWFEGPHLTRSWGGLRTALETRGLLPYARYTSGVWSNVDGGRKTGARYEGVAEWGLEADLDTLVSWPGATFRIGWHAFHGGQPTKALVGTLGANTVSNLEAKDHVRFYNITLTQRAFDDALEIKAGLLAVDDDFPRSEALDVFRNATFGNFTSGRALSAAPIYPLTGPGLYLRAQPVDAWRFRGGIYAADAGQDEWSNIGFDASFDDGIAAIGEVSSLRRPFDLPGEYTAGASYSGGATREVSGQRKQRDNWLIFGQIEQQLWRAADDASRIHASARLGIAPRQNAAIVETYAVTGLAWFGPIPGREDDVAAVGFTWNKFASQYLKGERADGSRVTQREWAFELTYRLQVTPWLHLQPDLQLIFDPHESRDDAVVLGFQAVVTL